MENVLLIMNASARKIGTEKIAALKTVLTIVPMLGFASKENAFV